MRTAAISLAIVILAGGCFVDVDFGGTHFTCDNGRCPDGYACIDAQCVLGGADAGRVELVADATPALPDAQPPQPDAPLAALLTCDEQYGAISGYQLCIEAANTCAFFALTSGGTCETACAGAHGTCVTAFDASETAPCTTQTEDGCTAVHQSQYCVCSRTPAPGV